MKNQNKEIKEMSEVIASKICEEYSPKCEEWQPHNCGQCYANSTHISEVAEALYTAGYRKQSVGEWKDRYNGKYANSLYVCSICDGKSLLATHRNELLTPTVKQILTPYCPHCGAKMKGGE